MASVLSARDEESKNVLRRCDTFFKFKTVIDCDVKARLGYYSVRERWKNDTFLQRMKTPIANELLANVNTYIS